MGGIHIFPSIGAFSWSGPTGQDNGWARCPDSYSNGWVMEELSRMHSSWSVPD